MNENVVCKWKKLIRPSKRKIPRPTNESSENSSPKIWMITSNTAADVVRPPTTRIASTKNCQCKCQEKKNIPDTFKIHETPRQHSLYTTLWDYNTTTATLTGWASGQCPVYTFYYYTNTHIHSNQHICAWYSRLLSKQKHITPIYSIPFASQRTGSCLLQIALT